MAVTSTATEMAILNQSEGVRRVCFIAGLTGPADCEPECGFHEACCISRKAGVDGVLEDEVSNCRGAQTEDRGVGINARSIINVRLLTYLCDNLADRLDLVYQSTCVCCCRRSTHDTPHQRSCNRVREEDTQWSRHSVRLADTDKQAWVSVVVATVPVLRYLPTPIPPPNPMNVMCRDVRARERPSCSVANVCQNTCILDQGRRM